MNHAVLAHHGLRRADINPIRVWMAECPQLNTLAYLHRAFQAFGHPLPRSNFSRWARRDNWTLPNSRNRLLLEESTYGQIPADSWFEREGLPAIERALLAKFVRKLTEQQR